MGLSAPNPEVFSLFERKDPKEANKGGDTPPLRPPHARPRADYTQLRSPRNAKPRSGKPERGFLPAKATDGNNDCTPFGGPFPRRGSPSPELSRNDRDSQGFDKPLSGCGQRPRPFRVAATRGHQSPPDQEGELGHTHFWRPTKNAGSLRERCASRAGNEAFPPVYPLSRRLAGTRAHKSPLGSGRGAKTFQWKVFAWGNPIKGFPHGGRAALSALPFLNSPFFLLFPACRATMFLQGFPLKKNSHGRHNVLRAHYALHEVHNHPIQPVSRHPGRCHYNTFFSP